MRIELYTITWNDKTLLPHFLRHYESWIDKIIVFDDHSDDGSQDILRAHSKVDLRTLPDKGDSFVLTALEIWNHAWKESRDRADWVIVSNVDEFFVHPTGARSYLESIHRSHHTIVHPLGFEMVGDHFPIPDRSLVDALPNGVPMFGQDKMQLFNPNAIAEMRFTPGRHRAQPQGRVKIARDPGAKLLHYKYVDTAGYLLARQRTLGERMLAGDRSRGFGMQYRLDSDEITTSANWLRAHSRYVLNQEWGDRLNTATA
jgi:glycosyltransferase involved in cell wall biosynthesis